MMMKDKKYIIFDLDGTLVDSFNTVVAACKKVLASCSPDLMLSNDFFETYRGKDMEQMFRELAELGHISTESFREKYDKQYATDSITGSTVIDSQYEILKEAKANGIGIIVITNKKQEIAEDVCRQLFGNNTVDIIIGRIDAMPIKPRHVIIDRLHELDVISQIQHLRYYGDSVSDSKTAKLLNIDYINVKNS